MKFSTHEDVEAPIAQVFEAISDFDHFERQLLRRGVDVVRTDSLQGPCSGMTWKTQATIRGRSREVRSTLTEFAAASGLRLESDMNGVSSVLAIELLALSTRRTRLRVAMTVASTNFSGRLFVQSLKLARSSLQRRFEERVAGYAKEIEGREV